MFTWRRLVPVWLCSGLLSPQTHDCCPCHPPLLWRRSFRWESTTSHRRRREAEPTTHHRRQRWCRRRLSLPAQRCRHVWVTSSATQDHCVAGRLPSLLTKTRWRPSVNQTDSWRHWRTNGRRTESPINHTSKLYRTHTVSRYTAVLFHIARTAASHYTWLCIKLHRQGRYYQPVIRTRVEIDTC